MGKNGNKMCQKFIKWVSINQEFIWDFISLESIFKNIIFNVYQNALKIKGNKRKMPKKLKKQKVKISKIP